MEKKLRPLVFHVQPVLVWDDGEEMTPAPELEQRQLSLSGLIKFAEEFPDKLEALQHELEAERDSSDEV